MSEQPTGQLQTLIGTVNYTYTQADHVYIGTESRRDEAITIRGVPYHLSCHLYLIGGQWTTENRTDLYLTRRDRPGTDASLPARNTAKEVLCKAWTDYLAERPELTRAAAAANAKSLIITLARELDELENQASAKRTELEAVKTCLAALL